MSHPNPDYAFPPNWKPLKKFNCKKWILPSTLLLNGRKKCQVAEKETPVKVIKQKGFTCVICGSYILGREKANFHMFQKHYQELCKLGGDAIPPEIKPDFNQPTWGVQYLKETMKMANHEIEMSVNKIKTRSSSQKIHSGIKPQENSKSASETANKPLSRNKDASSTKKRIDSCKKCESCLKLNCKSCRACKDMIKYGGPGTLKQSCFNRPKCLKFVPTEKGDEAFLKKSFKKVGRPQNLVKSKPKEKNGNYKTENVQEIMDKVEDIPPFKPRAFPLTDKDYNQMMEEDVIATNYVMDGGKDQNSNPKKIEKKWKDILIPIWKISDKEAMESHKGAGDYDDPLDMYKSRQDSLKDQGDHDDFEDTSDEAYIARHAKANLTTLEAC